MQQALGHGGEAGRWYILGALLRMHGRGENKSRYAQAIFKRSVVEFTGSGSYKVEGPAGSAGVAPTVFSLTFPCHSI